MNGKAIDAAVLLLKNSSGAHLERRVDILWKLARGVIWDSETDSTAAGVKTVPSGAAAAEIGSIGGKTMLWNQKVCNPDFSQQSAWQGMRGTVSYHDGALVTCNTKGNVSIYNDNDSQSDFSAHKYLLFGDIEVSRSGSYRAAIGTTITSDYMSVSINADTPTHIEGFITLDEEKTTSVRFGSTGELSVGDTIALHGLYCVDLTLLFGSGHEPADVSDPCIAVIEAYAMQHPTYQPEILLDAAVTRIESRDSERQILGTVEIPAVIRALEGYGQSAIGGNGNTLNLMDGTYTEIGHYVDGAWTLLDAPVVTDVSGLLPDNLLRADAGGTICFLQDGAAFPLPNRVDYLIRLDEVET